MGTIDVVAYVMNPSDSGLTNNEFAALMIATLHEEARLRRRNIDISRGIEVFQIGGAIVDFLGDVDGLLRHQDRSTGIANLRPSVVSEILQGVIPLPENIPIREGIMIVPPETIASYGLPQRRYTQFDTQIISNLRDLYASAHGLDNRVYDGEFSFLQSDNASLWLMGANLERGILRSQAIGIEPSIFNISTWWNKGIQAEEEFTAINDEDRTEAFDHANRVIQTYLDIAKNAGAFGLEGIGTEVLTNQEEQQYLTEETKDIFPRQ